MVYFRRESILFYIGNEINKNSIICHDDDSFGYVELVESWSYQIILDECAQFILNFDSNHKCTSCEGFVTKTKHVILKNLETPKSKEGGLFVQINFKKHDKELRTLTYNMHKNQLYFDKKNNIFAIGDLDSDNFYQFGKGQFVSISDKGELNCVLIHFDNIVVTDKLK